MILRTHFLTEEQLIELDALCHACKLVDGNQVAIYRHLLTSIRPIPSNVLYYINDQLVGFLRIFFFHEHTCEIALMVHPAHRRQGIAKQMLNEIEEYFNPMDTQTITVSVPHETLKPWLTSLKFEYQGSEYKMQYLPNEPSTTKLSESVELATLEDIPMLCTIDKACFTKNPSDLEYHFQELLEGKECDIFIIKLNGVPVGKTHLFWYTDSVRLTDIAVLPQAQGRGLATQLINHSISLALAANITNISLDVETHKKNALNLYTRLGFIITNAHDYWSVSINQLI